MSVKTFLHRVSRMMRLSACFLLVACAPLLKPSAAPERFDLGLGEMESVALARPIPFELRATPVLETSAMRYRLHYADPVKVREYARSRWAGTPAEILGQYLKSHLNQPGESGATSQPCRYTLELLRFEQVFTGVETSHALIVVQARLKRPGMDVPDERHLELTAPAPTPDANGGVKALAQAADRLARELRQRFSAQDCMP
jgi:cholesterol transport system auxiliary component